MHIPVTLFTGRGRRFEIRVNQPGADVRRLVALDTGRGAMSSQQWERCFCVIEAGQFLPRPGRMTSLATSWTSACSHLQHPLLELALVRVSVATGAGQILPMIDRGRFGLELRGFFVTIAARNREVSVGERKVSFFMSSQRERRWLVGFEIVAAVASVEIRRSRELPGMLVAVAVGAVLEFHFEHGVFTLGNVALRALQPGVPSLQRISR